MVLAYLSEQIGSEPATRELPKVLRDILTKARTSWLRNQEVVDLLSRHRQYGFRVSKEPPQKPPGMLSMSVHYTCLAASKAQASQPCDMLSTLA